MADGEKKNFVMETDDGPVELTLTEVKSLASKGDTDAMFALGMAYIFGHAVEQNKGLGYDLLERSAEAGNPDSKILLVQLYFDGDYLAMTAEQAWGYIQDARDAGIAEGFLYSGLAHMDGIGVDQDYVKAAEDFNAAAQRGNQEARNSLAYLYMNGLGVPQDETKAFGLFKNAANSGNVNAQYQTGICYQFGTGCKPDWKKAADFLTRAAEQGDVEAMERLGYLFYEGSEDLPADDRKSFEWFLQAAGNGSVSSM